MAKEDKKTVEKEIKEDIKKSIEKKEEVSVPKEELENVVEEAKVETPVKVDKKKEKEEKVELEREYIIPMRRRILKVPRYKRAKRAVNTIKDFLAKHMKVEERDTRKVKIDMSLNEEVWFRGIKKPLTKVKVKAKKINGIVYAELAELPKIVEYKLAKEKKFLERANTKSARKPAPVKEVKKEVETTPEKKEEKTSAPKEIKKEVKKEASKEKHVKKTAPVRKAMKR